MCKRATVFIQLTFIALDTHFHDSWVSPYARHHTLYVLYGVHVSMLVYSNLPHDTTRSEWTLHPQSEHFQSHAKFSDIN